MRKLVFYNLVLIIAVLAFSCHTNYEITDVITQNMPVGNDLASPDSSFVKLVKPYKDSLENDMLKVVGISEFEMEKDKPESLLSNFMGDLLLDMGQSFCKENSLAFVPDMAYVNYGGMRVPLPKGQITVRNIFELMPFENEMVFVQLDGDNMMVFIDKIASRGGDGIAGAQFGIKDGKAFDILVGGQKIDPGKTYWIVTNDYVAGGGDSMDVLKNDRVGFNASGKLVRDIIIAFLSEKHQKGELITSKLDGRIYYE